MQILLIAMMIATIARFEMSGAFDLGIFTPRKWCGFCHVYLDSFKACPGLMIAHPQRTLDGALVGVLTVASIRLADRRPLNFCHCYWQSRVPYEHERCAAHGPHHVALGPALGVRTPDYQPITVFCDHWWVW